MMIVDSAVAAADVRYARPRLQLLDDAVERGQPVAHQVLAVAGAEEDLRPGEETVVVLVPVQARAAAERLDQAVLVGEERRQDVVRTEQVELALIVGERDAPAPAAACTSRSPRRRSRSRRPPGCRATPAPSAAPSRSAPRARPAWPDRRRRARGRGRAARRAERAAR